MVLTVKLGHTRLGIHHTFGVKAEEGDKGGTVTNPPTKWNEDGQSPRRGANPVTLRAIRQLSQMQKH